MYRQIDFTTDYRDEQGRQYYKPPTFEIAKIIKSSYFEDFQFGFKLDCTVLQIFLTPILQRANWFQSEKRGERKHIATFYFDVNSEVLTLNKKYEENPGDHEFSIPEYLFSFLRPTDFIEILCPDVSTTGEKILIKYRFRKAGIENKSKIKTVKGEPDERVFSKFQLFNKTVLKVPKTKRKGKNNAEQRAAKIWRQRG